MVRRIPRGRVATYGQIAQLAGIPRDPRRVGYALSGLDDLTDVPWHRVINSKGEISRRSEPDPEMDQLNLLKKEGIRLNRARKISLERYQWQPGKPQ